MNKHEVKYCPRCKALFECKVGSILLCQCKDIVLTEKESDYIRKQYDDCLCVHCMKELKNEYHNENFQSRLKAVLGIFYKKSDKKK